MKVFFLLIISLIILIRCNPECVCTLEFRMITVEITDSLHYPLTNLQTRTTDTKGNTIIPINKKVDFLENVYVIADDSNLNSIKTSPTQIVFTVTDSIKSKSYHFVLYLDECKCHVYKLEGPEKIIF